MRQPPAEIPALVGKRVLICENEGITIMQLSRAVSRLGLTVVGIAATAVHALELAIHDRPEVIFLDIRIPGSDGLQLIREILTHYPACIIALVASSQEAREAAEAGCSAAVIKPADSSELLRTLPACVERFEFAVVHEPAPESESDAPPPDPDSTGVAGAHGLK